MPIIQHLIVDQYGAFVGKHSERLIVIKGKEKLVQAPLIHLESVTIANRGISLSADVVEVCAERGIPIHFLSPLGNPLAGLYSAGLTATIATRRAQLQAYYTGQGIHLALAFSQGKLTNQIHLLRYLAKYRKRTAPAAYQTLAQCAAEIQEQLLLIEHIPSYPEVLDGSATLEQVREEILGREGTAARAYWRAIACVLPETYHFPGRTGRGARDPINAALNYGYGVLYAQVERALVLAGLDPYAGFLHADRPGKPSLVLDLIEEFRQPVVDRAIIALSNRGSNLQLDEHHTLPLEVRRTIARAVLHRLERPVRFEGRRFPLRAILQTQARRLAAYLRTERESYTPYRFAW